MLRNLQPTEFDQYVDFAYDLALDLSQASFPIYNDGVKTKEYFIERSKKGMERDNEEILLYEEDGVVKGWIHYNFIEEDAYIGANNILVQDDYVKALDELLTYWEEKYPGYEWNLYFPEENEETITFLEESGCEDLEQSIVDILLFENYQRQPGSENVISITKDNFEMFRKLHASVEDEMFWTSDKILEDLDHWEIFAYQEDGECIAALYHNGKGDKDLEIFGIDGEVDDEILEALLTACLNKGKVNGARSMYFFNDEQTHEIARKLGFYCATVAHFFSEVCE